MIISEAAAVQVAEAELDGAQVEEIELEFEHGRWVYSIETSTKEVTVDAISGEVLGTEAEDD